MGRILEYSIHDSAAAIGLNLAAKKTIHASPLPPALKQLIEESGHCRPSRCFDNSWLLVMKEIIPRAEYVLSLGVRVLPVEHAIICVDGTYYDPTWELHLGSVGKEYLVVDQWGKDELFSVARKSPGECGGIYPPMIRHLEKSDHFRHLFKG